MHIESGSKTGLMEAHQFVLIGVWDITQGNRLCTCYGVNVVDCVPHRFHAGATYCFHNDLRLDKYEEYSQEKFTIRFLTTHCGCRYEEFSF